MTSSTAPAGTLPNAPSTEEASRHFLKGKQAAMRLEGKEAGDGASWPELQFWFNNCNSQRGVCGLAFSVK